jgi:peptidoglycan biosynthesis protein MviN/MurJ (putative lipid II flippase)
LLKRVTTIPRDKIGKLLISLMTLNVFDAFMTLMWTRNGIAEEVNPAMLYLLNLSPVLFVVIKISLVSLGAILLWRMRQFKITAYTCYLLNIVYAIIALIHFNIFVRSLPLL